MKAITTAIEIVIRRRIVFIVALAIGLVVMVAVLKTVPKTYEAAARVLIVAASNGRDPSVTSIDLPSVATSTAVLTRVVQTLNLPVDLIELKRTVRAGVKAKSSIMEIDYRDKSADRAVAVPNAIADELVAYYDSISSSGADVTIRKLDSAIADVALRLRTVDDEAARQTRMHPFAQSDKALDDATSRLDELTSQRRLGSATLAADVAQQDAISPDPATQSRLVRYEKLANDPTYRELASGTAKDEAQLAFTRAAFTPEYPGLRIIETKVNAEHRLKGAQARRTLASPDAFSGSEVASAVELRKAKAAVAGDRAKLEAIDALIAGANGRLSDTLGAGVSTERLKLQHDAAKADYLALTARRTAAVASRAEALSLGSVVVVDRAVRADTAVVGLGSTRLGLMLAVLMLALAMCAAFIADALDARLARADQVEKFYGVPLVATIGTES